MDKDAVSTERILCLNCGNTKDFIFSVVGECRYASNLAVSYDDDGQEVDREEDNFEYSDYEYDETDVKLEECGECYSTDVETFDSTAEMIKFLEENPEIGTKVTGKKI